MATRKSTAERFWAKVDRSDGPDACWPWTGHRARRGYGQFKMFGRSVPAHRVAWELTNGPIPPGDHFGTMCACHRCDNPPCCNPTHLFLGSMADNVADRDAKGRGVFLGPIRPSSGDQHHTRLHPEKLHRGDDHWTRRHPEWVARGDRAGARTHPESTLRGANHPYALRPELHARGERTGNAKLTEANVRYIREQLGRGVTQQRLANELGVNQTIISDVKLRKTWAHVL